MSPSNYQSSFRSSDNKFLVVPHATRFKNFEIPPDVPEDPHFKLAMTTFICRCSPSGGMNILLELFETQVISEVTKMSREKFAVKLDVFDKGLSCSMKFRMYRQQSGEHAMEFQRRSGDAVAFHKVYQQACLKLEPRSDCTETFADATPLWEPPNGQSSIAEFSPLIDMLSFLNAPELQAEAATGLADIASGHQAAAVITCSEHLFEHLTKLLQIDRVDVAYPIACLLSSLADCVSVKTLLVDHGLLPAMKEQMLSAQKTTLVKQQLGAAVTAWCQQEL